MTGSASGSGVRDLLAWLLRVNRMHGTDEAFAVGAMFARAYEGIAGPVHPAQVTRWETGKQAVNINVVRQYEKLLGLGDGTLTTVIDFSYRVVSGVNGTPSLARPAEADLRALRTRTDIVLDQALSGAVMHGRDWDELSMCILYQPGLYIYPKRHVDILAQRLVSELLIAEGEGWLQRNEALCRLYGLSWMEEAIVDACDALVTDRSNQVFIEPLTLLAASHTAAAGRSIVSQILHPTNRHALRAAWLAVAEKVEKGEFTNAQLRLLIEAALDIMTDSDLDGCRLAASVFLRGVPNGLMLGLLTTKMRRQLEVRPKSSSMPQQASPVVAGRLAAAALSAMPRACADADLTLLRLLGDMLYEPQVTRRLAATFLLAATPYRQPLAAALLRELRNPDLYRDLSLATAIVRAAAGLGGVAARRLLEQLATATGIPTFVNQTAIWSLGHTKGTSSDAFWSEVMRAQGASQETGRAVVYALGIERKNGLLRRFAADDRMPWPVRDAAAWWLRLPTHILDSCTAG